MNKPKYKIIIKGITASSEELRKLALGFRDERVYNTTKKINDYEY